MGQTLEAQLNRVESAIASVEANGQSVSIQGVTYTKANLQSLYDRQDRLLRKIQRADRGGGIDISVAEF
jgi:hypothetical protein